ncbi:MAG: 5-oxoprolinase, partial [Alphaproteobacteria bacterium]|nr:5-oxoprolinase [Alphaproteobacteria bacterium]
ADLRAIAEETIEAPLADAGWRARAHALAARATDALQAQGATGIEVQATLNLKYEGADSTLPVAFSGQDPLADLFEVAHRRRFGFADPERAIIVASVTAEAISRSAAGDVRAPLPLNADPPSAQSVSVFAGGAARAALLYQREDLPIGFAADGPALVREQGATSFIDAGWAMRVTAGGDILVTRRAEAAPESTRISAHVDPILLEVFNNRFMAVAEEMGLALQAAASSVNIKERLDFSCAVFDNAGGLVANAPHIPVHLGSMGDSVREIIRRRGAAMRAGDVFMLNAPHAGGTHLPDITVIAPIMLDAGDAAPAFFTAARGHHGDIGGLTPGSMPPHSRSVDDEGVLIETFQLVEAGRLREREARALFATGAHPARDIDRNIADLKAQIAACLRGGDELRRLVSHYGRDGVAAYMGHVQDNAEEHIRRVIDRLGPGRMEIALDVGAKICVAITPDHERRTVRIDFTGTSAQHAGNFNAPLSITRAATLYVFRTLVDDDIPLNEGCLKPIEIIVPEGSLLNPAPGAAVVAGNVETSQVIVDALYGALGVLAAAQGTMNNFTFGDARRQYYETICGGAGAGPDFDGADAVQTHMTNSRLTDPEVLEQRFPVIVESFAIRSGSGGGGAHKGGDGVVRRIRFREPMAAAILSNRRSTAPFGLCGGGAGAPGTNSIERADGDVERLGATAAAEMTAGDVFVIETPGGGGYGRD